MAESTLAAIRLIAGTPGPIIGCAIDELGVDGRDARDRYGRELAYIRRDDVDLGRVLIAEGLARARYDAQDVLLEQSEERFHRRVVAGGADLAHGSDEAVMRECSVHFPSAELRSTVRMQNAAGVVGDNGEVAAIARSDESATCYTVFMAVLSHHDANDPVDAIFEHLALPTNLRMHMYRVTALGLAVSDASTVAVNVNALRRVLLVHDVGNLVKMDELDADARAIRDKMTAEYGSDDHAISEGIAQELGFDAYELDLLRRKVFINNADVQQSNDFTLKIAAYADQRVTPDGIDSLLGRLLEAKDRYVAKPGSSMNRPDTNRNIELAVEIERQLTANSSVAVYDIGEANARPFLDSLPSRPL